jgi:serine/threonine-protein kinase
MRAATCRRRTRRSRRSSATYGADSPYQVAEVYGARGDADKAFEWLEKTTPTGTRGCPIMKMDPTLGKIRSDPRYQPLLEKMGLDD